MGLGVIAVGIVCALPFRHAVPPEAIAEAGDSSAAVGEGVPLQVPGQKVIANFAPFSLRPFPVEEEPVDDDPAIAEEAALVASHTAPELPDQYRPLFRPEVADQAARSEVVQPSLDGARPAPKPDRWHTIHDGDTLESLAVRFYGDVQKAPDILQANRAVLSDPQLLPIGVRIIIPRDLTGVASVGSLSASDTATRKLVPLPTTQLLDGR